MLLLLLLIIIILLLSLSLLLLLLLLKSRFSINDTYQYIVTLLDMYYKLILTTDCLV